MIDTITIYVDMTLFLPSVVLFAALPVDQNLGEININNIQCLLKSYIGGQICASGGWVAVLYTHSQLSCQVSL